MRQFGGVAQRDEVQDDLLGLEQRPPVGEKAESQWRAIWRRLKRNRVAAIGGAFLAIAYLVVVFAEFFAPYGLQERHRGLTYVPPQLPRFVDAEGDWHFRPFVYALDRQVDRSSMRRYYELNEEKRLPVYFIVRGKETYRLLGLFETNLHLFGTREGAVLLLGTDRQGRDMLSRMIFGGRISLSVGLAGVLLSIIIGSFMGVFSGYYGGLIDNVNQRFLEILLSFPSIPLWMALAAAMPHHWTPIQIYFVVTVILSLVGWAGLARQVRGMVLSMREADFISATRAIGAGVPRILFLHVLPNCSSHIIVVATLAIPNMILAETALSFLGLGIRPPMTSWGVLLQEAQNVRSMALYPWLILPAFCVVLTVLAYNFVGDGLRDAADPYSMQ